jgi:hypothetical protein
MARSNLVIILKKHWNCAKDQTLSDLITFCGNDNLKGIDPVPLSIFQTKDEKMRQKKISFSDRVREISGGTGERRGHVELENNVVDTKKHSNKTAEGSVAIPERSQPLYSNKVRSLNTSPCIISTTYHQIATTRIMVAKCESHSLLFYSLQLYVVTPPEGSSETPNPSVFK